MEGGLRVVITHGQRNNPGMSRMRVCGVLVSSVLCLVMTRLMMKMCLCCQASSCGFIPSQVPEVCACVRFCLDDSFFVITHGGVIIMEASRIFGPELGG